MRDSPCRNPLSPRQRRQKILMVLRLWRQTILLSFVVEAIGKPQEEGVMSTTTSFPSVKNQGLIDQ